MKRVILFRHGKSEWEAGVPDPERPLAKRGRSAARRMGRFLEAAAGAPQRVLTSSALRARETVELAAAAGSWNCPIDVVPSLYDANPDGVLEILRAVDDGIVTVLLCGHEPTWSKLGAALVGGGRLRFPTAALAAIDLDVASWRDASFGAGELAWLLPPRLLAQVEAE